MVVTDRFVFVHVPKTGGTFVAKAIREHYGGEPLAAHLPYDRAPDDAKRLPVMCFIRDPWDWYVSWYSWALEWGQSERGQRAARRGGSDKAAIWTDLLRCGEASFEEVVTRACGGDFDHSLTPLMRAEGIDLYTAFVRHICGDAINRQDFTALRYEAGLRTQLVGYLRAHTSVPKAAVAVIREAPPERVSNHGPSKSYYTPVLHALVGERTAWLRERFGY